MGRRIRFTRRLQKTFLARLKACGNVSYAAEKVGVSRSRVYQLRDEDHAFAEGWDEALDAYVEEMEAEADRRGKDGNEKAVYYGGKQIGSTKDFSDQLLMFRLKALKPERYRERSDTKVSGDVTVIRKVYRDFDE